MKISMLDILLDPAQLVVRFQPIFHLQEGEQWIDSYEALVRGPQGTNFERADILFDYVRRKKAEGEVDRSCVSAICHAVEALPAHVRINFNVHAGTLANNPGFTEFFEHEVSKRSLAIGRFTAEIVEHAPSYNVPRLIEAIRSLRECGVRIALDDVGLGTSNYRMILDCDPDYFKLDAYFVQGVSVDSKRRAVARSLLSLADSLGGSVVAEGAESTETITTLSRLGVELFQANLLCAPLPLAALRDNGLLEPEMAVAPPRVTARLEIARPGPALLTPETERLSAEEKYLLPSRL